MALSQRDRPVRYLKFAPIILLLNIEWVLIPFFRNHLGLQGFILWLASNIWASGELIFWYQCAGEVLRVTLKNPKVKQAIEEGKGIGIEVKEELKESGLMDKIVGFVLSYINPHRYKSGQVVLLAKSGSYFSIFLLGAFFPFFVGVFICRTAKWRSGFRALAAGNILKTTLAVIGWSFVPHWVGDVVVVFYCLAILGGIIYFNFKKKKSA